MPRPHPCLAPQPAPIAPHHLSTAPLPPAPIGLASSASRPPHAVARIASTPLRAAIRIPLCRHRADSALIAPPSRPSCAAAVLHVLRFAVRIAPTVRRHPRRPPPALSSRCVGPGALAGKNRTACIPFSPNARKRPPSWQHPAEMHAFRDQDGNILAPCIHFRAQSGDSGYMARESCRQGPFSRRGARNHAWREDVASAARPFRGSGMQSGRTGFAPCGAGLACLPHAPPLPSRPRSSPPSYTRRASPSETRHAVPVPMHLAICAPHPSRQPRGPTASRKQAEQHKQLNAGIKIGSPNRDPIEELFGFAQRLPDALQPLHQANELALSYLDHSTRQRLGGYVIGLSGNSFTVDLYAALVDHATSIAR